MGILIELEEEIFWLKKIIEIHCRGELIPENVIEECPHYAKMLNENLKKIYCYSDQVNKHAIMKIDIPELGRAK